MLPRSLIVLGSLGLSSVALAAEISQLEVGDAISLTDDQSPDKNSANKIKILRLGNGTLVSVFGDGVGDDVYDTKADAERPARDVFARICNPDKVDCDALSSWSGPVNLSNTALRSSLSTAWHGEDFPAEPFAGDSDKPNIFASGANVVVTWVDKYCPGGEQRSVSYIERDGREVPYSCTYVVRSTDSGKTWSAAQQLTSGIRDAKGDVSRGTSAAWTIVWQEDPSGLQLGEAEGPGEGASGANVSHGTDIWYTALPMTGFSAGESFPEAVRVTDNFTRMDRKQGEELDIEAGQEGAARPNLALIGPAVILAYEETKGSEGVDFGKVIRYHSFMWNAPPVSCLPGEGDGECRENAHGEPYPALDDPERMGCIISDPGENARRVRFLAQGTPGPTSDIKLSIFWRQGQYDQGGPADVFHRSGFASGDGPLDGFGVGDFDPPVAQPTGPDAADGCFLYGDEDDGTGAFANSPGLNLSTLTPDGGDLDGGSDDNPVENALAHRGLIKGDFIALGYSYTDDWALANFTDQDNYDFWIRTSKDGGRSWDEPIDLTSESTAALAAAYGLSETGVHVKEPRIVKTPGNGPGCPSGDPDASDTTNPMHCTAPGTYIVAWGTEVNTYSHLGGGDQLDLFITRTTDKGATYEPYVSFAGTAGEEFESQLRPTPDGSEVYLTWNVTETSGAKNSYFATAYATLVEVEEPDTDVEPEPEESRGCSTAGGAGLGSGLVALLAGALLLRRRRRD